jgi:hypothetical protein
MRGGDLFITTSSVNLASRLVAYLRVGESSALRSAEA